MTRPELDLASVDRIIAAVDWEGRPLPEPLDREEILRVLENIMSLYHKCGDFEPRPRNKPPESNKIVKTATTLKQLIELDDVLKAHVAALDELISDVTFKYPKNFTNLIGIDKVSAFEKSCRVYAQNIIPRGFSKARTTYTKDDHKEKITGPFIDFAEAAIREMGITNSGIPYARSSIAIASTAKSRKISAAR